MKRCSTSLAWREIQIGHDGKIPPIHSDEGQLTKVDDGGEEPESGGTAEGNG